MSQSDGLQIALDVSAAVRAEPTGVGHYAKRLVLGLAGLEDPRVKASQFHLVHRFSRLKAKKYFVKPPAGNFKQKIFQEPLHPVFARKVDVFHGLDARVPGAWWKGSRIATIHDIHSAFHTDQFADASFREMKVNRYRELVDQADALIVVSEASKNDVLETLKADPEKLHVIHEAGGEEFYPRSEDEIKNVKQKYKIDGDYLLYVGSINKRKNVPAMVRAFLRAREELKSDAVFALTGRLGYGGEELKKEIEAADDPKAIRFLGYVEDEDIAPLYSGALGLFFATLYEGFGIPVVEAFGCSCPVIVSKTGSLPEIAGGNSWEEGSAALLVGPEDDDSMAEGVLKLLSDESLRGEMNKRSLERAKAFSWAKTAEQHWQLYCKMAKSRS